MKYIAHIFLLAVVVTLAPGCKLFNRNKNEMTADAAAKQIQSAIDENKGFKQHIKEYDKTLAQLSKVSAAVSQARPYLDNVNSIKNNYGQAWSLAAQADPTLGSLDEALSKTNELMGILADLDKLRTDLRKGYANFKRANDKFDKEKSVTTVEGMISASMALEKPLTDAEKRINSVKSDVDDIKSKIEAVRSSLERCPIPPARGICNALLNPVGQVAGLFNNSTSEIDNLYNSVSADKKMAAKISVVLNGKKLKGGSGSIKADDLSKAPSAEPSSTDSGGGEGGGVTSVISEAIQNGSPGALLEITGNKFIVGYYMSEFDSYCSRSAARKVVSRYIKSFNKCSGLSVDCSETADSGQIQRVFCKYNCNPNSGAAADLASEFDVDSSGGSQKVIGIVDGIPQNEIATVISDNSFDIKNAINNECK